MADINKLVLIPTDIDYRPESWDKIQGQLLQAQFIGKAIPQHMLTFPKAQGFFVGERFLQLVTLMGCSPSLAFQPPDSGSLDFCHVEFSDLNQSGSAMFRCHSQGSMARCPQCGRRVADADAVLQSYLSGEDSAQYVCTGCAHSGSPVDLAWRHRAGVARVFIDVYSIYPQEGIPTDQLLLLLEQTSTSAWTYFYTDQ